MHRKGGNQEEYMIRKGRFQEEREDDYEQRGGNQNWRGQRNNGQRQPQTKYHNGKKQDQLNYQGMMNLLKPGGIKQLKNPSVQFKSDLKLDNKSYGLVQEKSRSDKYAQGEKEQLDSQLEQYRRCTPVNQRQQKTTHNTQRGGARGREQKQEKEKFDQQSKRHNQRKENSKNIVEISDEEGDGNRQDESNWLQPEKKEEEVAKKADESDWILNDQEDKSTSITNNRINEVLREEDFPELEAARNIDLNREQKNPFVQVISNPNKQRHQRGNNNMHILSKEQSSNDGWEDAKNLHSSSLNNGHIGGDSHQLSSLLDNEHLLEDEVYLEPKKEEEKLQISEQEVRAKLQSFQKDNFASVHIKFQAEENVLEIKVREIGLVAVGVGLKVHSNGKATFQSYPQITSEDIAKYISFKDVSHFFPRLLVNQPEDMPHLVEGDEESEPQRIKSCAELELCRIRCPSLSKQQGRIDQSIIHLRLVVVRCMQCDTKNEISVIHPDYSVQGSCHNCSAKILGKVTDLWLVESH